MKKIWILMPTPTQSVHSLSDRDHNLSSSSCPSSPQDNSDLEQVTVKVPLQDFAINSDVFVSIPETPSTVHVIDPMDKDYGYESSAESSDSDCVIISV